ACVVRAQFAVNESHAGCDTSKPRQEMRSRRPLNVDCPSGLGYRPTDMRSHPWLPPSRRLTAKIARAQATAVLRQLAYVPTASLGARAAGWPAFMSALPKLLRT